MRRVILEAFRDEETGEVGLGIASVRVRHPQMNAALEGLLIAHDLIEHVNGPAAIGTVDDELEALGAIWYARGQHNDINREGRGAMYSPEENVASDVIRMFRDVVMGGVDSAYDRSSLAGRACDADDDLQQILKFAEDGYLQEFGDEEEKRDARKHWPNFRRWSLLRMRAGYRKMVKRWEPRGRFAANSQFWAIAGAVQPYAKDATEGQQYVLHYGDGEATCSEFFPWEGEE